MSRTLYVCMYSRPRERENAKSCMELLSSSSSWSSGATGPDGHLHARKDPYSQDLPHPDLPCPLVAEDPRVCRDGLVPGQFQFTAY